MTQKHSIRWATVPDVESKRDFLGFAPYVEALARFLTNEHTIPPLTLSVEGEWGSGKSSFMSQLESAVVDLDGSDNEPIIIKFNPWKHEEQESLWSAFALQYISQVTGGATNGARIKGHVRLFRQRFNWSKGWPDILRIAAFVIFSIGIVVGLPVLTFVQGLDWLSSIANGLVSVDGTGKTITKWLVGAAGTGGFVVLLVTLLSRAKTLFGNPLEINLKQYIRSPNYEDRVTFIEQFDADLERITEAFAGGRRVYVFIDDLDRAEVPKAADLMKALSMMIPSSRNAIFILGMDREKVAAGLAVKNERLVPYIGSVDSSSPGSTRLRSRRQRGLEYGRSYIEKFIQLSVAVPRPGEDELRNYIDSIASPPTAASAPDSKGMTRRLWHWLRDTISRIAKRLRLQRRVQPDPGDDTSNGGDGRLNGNGGGGPPLTRSRTYQIVEGDDRDTLQRIVGVLAPALDNNPRRIKHFINLFRFRAYIGEATGLFDDTISTTQTITLEQLAKYVVIMLKWPLLINDLETTPDLYGRLEETALDPLKDSRSPWGEVEELLDLIRLGLR